MFAYLVCTKQEHLCLGHVASKEVLDDTLHETRLDLDSDALLQVTRFRSQVLRGGEWGCEWRLMPWFRPGVEKHPKGNNSPGQATEDARLSECECECECEWRRHKRMV